MMDQGENKNQNSVLAGGKVQVDYTLIYFSFFLIFGSITSFLFSSYLSGFNAAPSFNGLIKTLIVTLIFFIFLTIQPILVKSRWLNIVLAFIFSFLLISMHLKFYSSWLSVGALIFFLLYIIGLNRGNSKLNESLHISFKSYARSYLTPTIIGFSFLLSFLYAGLYSNNEKIPYPAYEMTVSVAMPFVQSIVPGFNEDIKVDEFFTLFVKKNLRSQPEFIELLDIDKTAVAQKFGFQLKDKFSQFTNLPVNNSESMVSYFYRVANGYLNTFSQGRFAIFVPLTLFLSLFYIFRFLFFVVKEIVILISGILYHLLQAFGIITIRTETRQKEVIVVR